MNHIVLSSGLIALVLSLTSCASNTGNNASTVSPSSSASVTTTAPSPVSSFKETAKADPAKVIPYPFTTCAVIRKDLGEGPTYRRVYKNQEVIFCCTPCLKAFDTNPEPYMPRIIQAAAAKARGEAVNSGW